MGKAKKVRSLQAVGNDLFGKYNKMIPAIQYSLENPKSRLLLLELIENPEMLPPDIQEELKSRVKYHDALLENWNGCSPKEKKTLLGKAKMLFRKLAIEKHRLSESEVRICEKEMEKGFQDLPLPKDSFLRVYIYAEVARSNELKDFKIENIQRDFGITPLSKKEIEEFIDYFDHWWNDVQPYGGKPVDQSMPERLCKRKTPESGGKPGPGPGAPCKYNKKLEANKLAHKVLDYRKKGESLEKIARLCKTTKGSVRHIVNTFGPNGPKTLKKTSEI